MDREQVPVLPGLEQDDPVTRLPSMSESQAGGSEIRSMGRKEPGKCPSAVSQSQVGEAACPFPRVIWCGRTMADGTDEESAYAARMDECIA